MWEKIVRRKHTALKVFPFGPDANEVMLYGTVQYGLKDGREATVDWAARAHLVKKDGAVMMDFYQVYLVSPKHTLTDDLHFSDFATGYRCTKSKQVGLAHSTACTRDRMPKCPESTQPDHIYRRLPKR